MHQFFKVGALISLILFSGLFGNEGKCMFVSSSTNKTKSFSWTHYDTTNSDLSSNFCRTLIFDQSGCIYIATGWKGLVTLKENSWVSYSHQTTLLPNDTIWDMDIDKSGKIWMATNSGLAAFNGIEWTLFNPENSPLPVNSVFAVAANNDSALWIGCGNATEGGLVKFKNDTWTIFTPDNSRLPCRIIQKIVIGSSNSVFIGTGQFQGLGGIVMIENGIWNVFNNSNSIMPYNSVDEIAVDRNNTIWIGTEAVLYGSMHPDSSGGAIMTLKNNQWEAEDPTVTGIASRRVTALSVDSSGNTWIATSVNPPRFDYALAIYDGTDWYALSLSNGPLPRMYIPDIVVDRSNNIWLATENGIYILKECGASVGKSVITDKHNKIKKSPSKIYDAQGRYLGMSAKLGQRETFQSATRSHLTKWNKLYAKQ
jgi:ligand-binding sensor domain-containing protein